MQDKSFHVLAESASFILGHSFESVYIVAKADGCALWAGDHYGDPTVGLISADEQWFITGGEGLLCCSAQGQVHTFFRQGSPPLGDESLALCWFVDTAWMETAHVLQVLIDPLSEYASAWQLNLDTLTIDRHASEQDAERGLQREEPS